MIDYFAQHQDYFFYALSGICLLVELSVLGLSGPLLFIGIGSALTGVLISLGLIHQFTISLVALAVLSCASAALLWGPLKKIQNTPKKPETSSDMVGKILPVTVRVTQSDGRVSYSGVEWAARLETAKMEAVDMGNRVEVIAVEGTLFIVKPV